MKKLLVLILSLLMLCAPLTAGAVSYFDGTTALNAQFVNGTFNGYDYVSFSPVKANDSTKYPLLVWLHGMRSGTYARQQLSWYEFSNWASDEYQARFQNAGGCFLLAPRAAKSMNNSWDEEPAADLKALIDDYISKNAANVDVNRIYIAGYSTGGTCVWDMLTAYPGFFAAGLPLAAIDVPNRVELKKLKDTSVWVMTSDHDPYIINETSDVRPEFDYLCSISNRPEGLRMTSFSEAFFANFTKKTEVRDMVEYVTADAEHYIWEAFTYDMFMWDRTTPYVCATTIDADGKTVSITDPEDGIIRWLSQQTRNEEGKVQEKLSFWDRIKDFFLRIINFFNNLF